jgi:hypothetical protein
LHLGGADELLICFDFRWRGGSRLIVVMDHNGKVPDPVGPCQAVWVDRRHGIKGGWSDVKDGVIVEQIPVKTLLSASC